MIKVGDLVTNKVNGKDPWRRIKVDGYGLVLGVSTETIFEDDHDQLVNLLWGGKNIFLMSSSLRKINP